MNYLTSFKIGDRVISAEAPTYFIADIAANHDGDLSRAKDLIWKAAEAGADVAKFQHFLAKDIVSDHGFRSLGGQMAHQAKWDKSVYEIYEQYQLNRDWNDVLASECKEAQIEFMTTPYDHEALSGVDDLVQAYKIGSGDITWCAFLESVAQKGKPVILSTGASTLEDVQRAVDSILAHNNQICLLQCNTNYTNELSNFGYINLSVLHAFQNLYPGIPMGLSDHTPGHATALGAVALGGRMIEKHFTDDNGRPGPDHAFSMTPITWREMVDRTRELEASFGDGVKRVEENEIDSAVVQRRCLRLARPKRAGETLTADDIVALRPAPADALPPYQLEKWLGATFTSDKAEGEALFSYDLRNDA